MNANDYHALFASLNHAIELLHRHRTPDPSYIVAYDTLKQSRAMLLKTLPPLETLSVPAEPSQLVAA